MVGPDEFDDTFLAGGYNDQYWPALAAALAAYRHQGDAGPLLQAYQQVGVQNENEFAVYNAVECSDAAWPRSWARWDADARKIYRTAPYEAWDNTWFNAACAFWPVHGPQQPMKIGASGLPGILMLQGTKDGATPYAGALAARRALPSARMVVVTGGGNHGQSLAQPAQQLRQRLPQPVPGHRGAARRDGPGQCAAARPGRCRRRKQPCRGPPTGPGPRPGPPPVAREPGWGNPAGAAPRQRELPLRWRGAAHQGVAVHLAPPDDRSRSRRGARHLRPRCGQ